MGLLGKVCKRLLRHVSRGRKFAAIPPLHSNVVRCDLHSELVQGTQEMLTCDSTTAVRGTCVAMQDRAESKYSWSAGCFVPESVVNVTSSCELEAGEMLLSINATKNSLCSESDSGVCLDENWPVDDVVSEYGEADFEYECECDECAFAQLEDTLQDWHISAKDMTLDKVLSSEQGETVYR